MKKNSIDYLKYSGLAFQMLAIIAAGVWLGARLDKNYNMASPVFTLVFALISVLLALGLVIKEFIRKK
ncbi:MAG: AtpZ/AtpI family protein [Flavobacteriales bacterium]|nr:AtpZ/AtpI family protein [Flavobacteriales bacterium]